MNSAIWNPTLAIVAGVWLGFPCTLTLALLNPASPWVLALCFAVNAALGVLAFTPLHEASHHLASRDPRINEAVMWLSWPFFLHSPFLFRTLHFRHHARVGQPDDPDAFTKRRSQLGRWAASFLIVANYYRCYLREARTGREVVHVLVSLAIPISAALFALASPWAVPLMVVWILPNLVAVGILGYIDTAWPHSEVSGTGPLHGTRNLSVPVWLEFLMGRQNLHQLHHLRPALPWYRYKEVLAEESAARRQAEVCPSGGGPATGDAIRPNFQ